MRTSDLLRKVLTLHSLYTQGLIKTLAAHEVHPPNDPGSRENYLYFTLPPCINFQRSSPAMWRAALATWNDSKANYLFYPEKIAKKSFATIQKDLTRHKLALQKNRHTHIWITISKTLREHFKNDPREILRAGDNDAEKILFLIRNDKKSLFPYLSGPKMANYWLYILSRYTDAQIENAHCISIIPDTHVIQCSMKLGLVGEKTTPESVAQAWKKLLDGSGIDPVAMHPVLWNWSRNDFSPPV